ncbi:MAG: bifunctional hydroxymethylpyrimidine kinase/phosphomethylpyrimidine kinase [Sulfurovum sp.]|nr:bifunctional hydroxymethylpyrimidine kinase/phosphomethylpyrimidine kinase [Sulfurovum sp.]
MNIPSKTPYYCVLSIAGSDSSGGAGIQADIKSISANGGYASTVITATTAQNTQGVRDIHAIPIPHLEAQMEAVLDDIDFGAIKIGMLHSSQAIEAVERMLRKYKVQNIVLDPVMVASSGRNLIDEMAIERLRQFLPYVTLLTPNIPEAEILLGHAITLDNVQSASEALGQKYQISVLLKGGHLDISEEMTDTLYIHPKKQVICIKNPAIDTQNTHGTGCSLSSSIATFLAQGQSLEEAVRKGCRYLNQAIKEAQYKQLGKGSGPINHFFL